MERNVGRRVARIVWVDRASRIVVSCQKAVALTNMEFVIFDFLHRRGGRVLGKVARTQEVVDEAYRGVGDPPLHATAIVRQQADLLNRKIARLGLRVKKVNRGRLSEYRLEERD